MTCMGTRVSGSRVIRRWHAVRVPRIQLEAAPDHVERLSFEKEPLQAVAELIWNGLDADAHNVEVTLARNEVDGIEAVTVKDDGHGMAPEACDTAFRSIGGSWKKATKRSLGESRPLHGESGQGRLRAFALGANVKWTTVADDTAGVRQETVIRASDSSRNTFEVVPAIPVSDPTGTTFEAVGKQNSYINRLAADDATEKLATTLAPYLIAHPDVSVIYDGSVIRPQDNIAHQHDEPFSFEHDGNVHEAAIRIIEWRDGKERSLHICDESGVPVETISNSQAPDFVYTVYVMWADASANRGDYLLEHTLAGSMLAAAKTAVAAYFDRRRDEEKQRHIARWKEAKTYPYEGEPASESESVERTAFDLVATSIHRHVPKEAARQRLMLGLLKDSMQHRPEDLSHTLGELLRLPPDEVERFEKLLKRTSLSNIIKATTSVTDRLTFLTALSHMVFDAEAKKLVKERDHLHKIMERELWVLGEQYNMMVSEVALKTVLDRHLSMLGRPAAEKGPVLRPDGRSGRVDLLLSASAKDHDRRRHLVIELKAPGVTPGLTEYNQVESYALAVAQDQRFSTAPVEWDFWLIASDFDASVRAKARQKDKPAGLAFEPELFELPGVQVRVWVKTWTDVIEAAEARLTYMKTELQSDPSVEDALTYLAENHADFLPPEFGKPDEAEAG